MRSSGAERIWRHAHRHGHLAGGVAAHLGSSTVTGVPPEDASAIRRYLLATHTALRVGVVQDQPATGESRRAGTWG